MATEKSRSSSGKRSSDGSLVINVRVLHEDITDTGIPIYVPYPPTDFVNWLSKPGVITSRGRTEPINDNFFRMQDRVIEIDVPKMALPKKVVASITAAVSRVFIPQQESAKPAPRDAWTVGLRYTEKEMIPDQMLKCDNECQRFEVTMSPISRPEIPNPITARPDVMFFAGYIMPTRFLWQYLGDPKMGSVVLHMPRKFQGPMKLHDSLCEIPGVLWPKVAVFKSLKNEYHLYVYAVQKKNDNIIKYNGGEIAEPGPWWLEAALCYGDNAEKDSLLKIMERENESCKKRLHLILDIDETIAHAKSRQSRGKMWPKKPDPSLIVLRDKRNPNGDAFLFLSEIRKFLEQVGRFYCIYICTYGGEENANLVAKKLDEWLKEIFPKTPPSIVERVSVWQYSQFIPHQKDPLCKDKFAPKQVGMVIPGSGKIGWDEPIIENDNVIVLDDDPKVWLRDHDVVIPIVNRDDVAHYDVNLGELGEHLRKAAADWVFRQEHDARMEPIRSLALQKIGGTFLRSRYSPPSSPPGGSPMPLHVPHVPH